MKLLMKLLMDLLMNLLIKSNWRRIFVQYLIDFQQKPTCLGDYPPLSAINALIRQGSFCYPKHSPQRELFL